MRQLKISKQITNRESLSLDRYLQEIGKYDLLTADDEVRLTKAIKEGLICPLTPRSTNGQNGLWTN